MPVKKFAKVVLNCGRYGNYRNNKLLNQRIPVVSNTIAIFQGSLLHETGCNMAVIPGFGLSFDVSPQIEVKSINSKTGLPFYKSVPKS